MSVKTVEKIITPPAKQRCCTNLISNHVYIYTQVKQSYCQSQVTYTAFCSFTFRNLRSFFRGHQTQIRINQAKRTPNFHITEMNEITKQQRRKNFKFSVTVLYLKKQREREREILQRKCR